MVILALASADNGTFSISASPAPASDEPVGLASYQLAAMAVTLPSVGKEAIPQGIGARGGHDECGVERDRERRRMGGCVCVAGLWGVKYQAESRRGDKVLNGGRQTSGRVALN